MADDVDFFRPLDYLAVEVCQNRDLGGDAMLAAAWSYGETHGRPALIEALETAATVEPLPDCLANVLAMLRQDAA